MEDEMENNTTPGFHREFLIDKFPTEEKNILKHLSNEWYLTNSGSAIQLAGSKYDYFLMKPTKIFSEMFNLDREIICVLSDYPHFEPRTLDAFDKVQGLLSELRVEGVCRVLISRDPSTEERIENILKTDPEQPIVIPFTFDELLHHYDDFFIRNRFRKHFYSRDLFSFLSPLKKDLYFFGRSELIQSLINRHRSGEHTGLFGLRKSGKTSIIYAIERALSVNKEQYISIDCESPSIHKMRWNELLYLISREFCKAKGSKAKLTDEKEYTEKRAAISFEQDILTVFRSKKRSSVLIIFDEVERIAPKCVFR
jgi:hypothetical protein